ncbi:MAG TPA: hypothetical protein VLA49_02415 [Anaerolineales bacterium]|nr:hypothetical protein [Anaerolineales bacterium]
MTDHAPHPREQWAVWYRDTFDRQAPARVDVQGQGLVQGLAELWARYLFETVQAGGQQGFSHFHLEWKHGNVYLEGDWQGARRLRYWLFGETGHTYKGYVQEAEPELLERIAFTHAYLIDREQASQQILTSAVVARDVEDFAIRLRHLREARS